MFRMLEDQRHRVVMVKLLNIIPWRNNDERAEEVKTGLLSSDIPKMRWMCLEVAFESCFKHNYAEGCIELLQECASWDRSGSPGTQSIATS